MQIPHNLKLRLSDCGKAIETVGAASATVAQMNPCGSLDKDENAMLGNLLASAPDLLRQRDRLMEILEQAASALRSAYAAAYCGPQNWTPEEREALRLQACDADAAIRAILAETEEKL